MDYKKASTLEEVDNAVRFDVPIGPDHPFFTNFSDVRGDFEDKMIYRSLNINPRTFTFNHRANQTNKTLLFLAGMRGSGKTSELAKIAQKLHNPEAFFCIICNLDDGLDLNDMEYMDILIFQLERLVEELITIDLGLNSEIIESLQDWYAEQIKEINTAIKREGGFEIELEGKTPSLLSILGLSAKLKGNLAGSKENAEKIRTVFKKNFTVFSQKFNEFIETINKEMRMRGVAQEVLFIIDGLEKIGLPVVAPAHGAFYVYVDVSAVTNDAMEWCLALLESEKVALTPGADFGVKNAHKYVRFAYTCDGPRLQEALGRIARFMAA